MDTVRIRDINKKHYEKTWKNRMFIDPSKWPHWKVLSEYTIGKCLEIGAGIRPKIAIKNNYFVDISPISLDILAKNGGNTYLSDLSRALPYKNNSFNFICAYEILEHLQNDRDVLADLHRVLKNNGVLSVSFPLHSEWFHEYDRYVGHIRRYDPEELDGYFHECGFSIHQYAPLSVIWVNKTMARIYSAVHQLTPSLFDEMTHIADRISIRSRLSFPINLLPWKTDSDRMLQKYPNALFILKKNKM